MINTQDELNRIESDLGEWKETLGDQFPSFLNRVLVARLMRAESEIRYLRSTEVYR